MSDLNVSPRISNNTRDRFENYASHKGGLIKPSWSQSDKSSTLFSGRRSSNHPLSGSTSVTVRVSSSGAMSPNDIELARIDADVEGGKVRVDREIQRLEEVYTPVV